MKEISSDNKNVDRFVKTILRNSKTSQKCEKKTNVISNYFIVEETLKINNSNIELKSH